jgi:hypothetical protein
VQRRAKTKGIHQLRTSFLCTYHPEFCDDESVAAAALRLMQKNPKQANSWSQLAAKKGENDANLRMMILMPLSRAIHNVAYRNAITGRSGSPVLHSFGLKIF